MPVEIVVPSLGESVVEATILRWLKKVGDNVTAGEPVVELETDKVNMEVAAEQSGILTEIKQSEGDTVKIGESLGILSSDGAASVAAASATVDAPIVTSATDTTVVEDAQPSASPVAQKIAADKNVDLQQVAGSGPSGKVMKEDVTKFIEKQAVLTTPAPKPATPAPVSAGSTLSALTTELQQDRGEERIKITRRRQTIAARLVEAQHTAAMLTTFNEVDMTAIMDVRKRRKDSFKEKNGVNLGFMSFFTKAVVGALKAFPYLNAEIQGDEILLKKYYDIGIAVSTNEGLVVPVLRNADKRSFAGIESGIVDLAVKAREGKLTLPELIGGTFTITNGGTFGSLLSTPILNTPQVGILGMHKIQERPIVKAGEIVIAPMMYVALSYDHRIVDGSEAVRFLVKVKELLEDPESLLLEG